MSAKVKGSQRSPARRTGKTRERRMISLGWRLLQLLKPLPLKTVTRMVESWERLAPHIPKVPVAREDRGSSEPNVQARIGALIPMLATLGAFNLHGLARAIEGAVLGGVFDGLRGSAPCLVLTRAPRWATSYESADIGIRSLVATADRIGLDGMAEVTGVILRLGHVGGDGANGGDHGGVLIGRIANLLFGRSDFFLRGVLDTLEGLADPGRPTKGDDGDDGDGDAWKRR